MKFQLKALAAAAILAASIPAHATIAANNTGNGSMILTVLDTVSNLSASFDLGVSYLDFNQVAAAGAVSNVTNPGTSFSWDLAGNADYSTAWSNFLTASTDNANIRYAITAGDNLGSGAGSRGYITTYTGAALVPTTTTATLTALAAMDLYTSNLTTALQSYTNHADVANGSSVQTPATSYYNLSKNNGTGPTAVGALGANLGVIQSVVSASSLTNATNTIFGNGAFFNLASNGTLVYSVAAVPEADTWAMMMLGLGFMGFVARRKQA
jgi:hypothetical protein